MRSDGSPAQVGLFSDGVPLLSVSTSVTLLDPVERASLCKRLSALIAKEVKKPERYVMVVLHPGTEMTFGGSTQTACCAELKNVGTFTDSEAERLSEILCIELARELSVKKDRIYIEFTNADGALWGWNGGTFG